MIISTLVLLKASHGQSIRRDLFTGLREWLDDIQSWPGTVFSFLGGKEREGCVFNMFLETVQIHSSQSWLNAQDFIISADVSPSIHLHQQPHHTMLLPDLLCDVNMTEATVPLQPSVTHLQGHSHHTLPQSAYVSSSPMWERVKIILPTAKTLPLLVSLLVMLKSHRDGELGRKQNTLRRQWSPRAQAQGGGVCQGQESLVASRDQKTEFFILFHFH